MKIWVCLITLFLTGFPLRKFKNTPEFDIDANGEVSVEEAMVCAQYVTK